MIKSVFPDLSALVIDQVLDQGTVVRVVARTPVTAAACPQPRGCANTPRSRWSAGTARRRIEGGRDGAPRATQVADRFHLLQNLGEAVEKTVIAHRADLPEPEPQVQDDPGLDAGAEPTVQVHRPPPTSRPAAPPSEPDGFKDVLGRERRLVIRHRERFDAVQALLAEGCSLAEICRRLQLSRDAVRRFARATSIEEVLVKATNRASILDPFKPYLNQRWNAGITNATTLHKELQPQGWKGDIQAVRRYLKQFRPADGRTHPARTATTTPKAPKIPAPPKPRQVVGWIMTHPDHLSDHDTASLTALLDRSPGLRNLAEHVRGFAAMTTELQGHRLDE